MAMYKFQNMFTGYTPGPILRGQGREKDRLEIGREGVVHPLRRNPRSATAQFNLLIVFNEYVLQKSIRTYETTIFKKVTSVQIVFLPLSPSLLNVAIYAETQHQAYCCFDQ